MNFKILLNLFLGFSLFSCAANSKGPIREHLKKKFQEKMEAEPAPKIDFTQFDQIVSGGLWTGSIELNSNRRLYKIYLPKNFKESTKKFPVVMAFHGGGGDMSIQSNDEYYQFLSNAEKNQYIVVFPNGYSRFQSGRLATWNAGKCCGEARDKSIQDVEFVNQLVQSLKTQKYVDAERFFAVGMSNGGMMAYQLACSTNGVFRGIASVTGTDNTTSCASPQATPIFHIHARDDDHVLFNGGKGEGAFEDPSKITDFVSVPATIEKWRSINQCEKESKVFLKVEGATCEEWSNCKSKKPVRLCVTDTGGHSWPGGTKPDRAFRKSKPTSKAISATEQIWQFFSKL